MIDTQTRVRAVDTSIPVVTVDVPFSPPPRFGDDRAREDYQIAVERQRQTQTSRWCIAPLATVTSRTRGLLSQGEALTLDDVGGSTGTMGRLVQLGIVTAIDARTAEIRSAPPSRYTIGPRAIITHGGRGILSPGQSCSAADFARAARPHQPARPAGVSDDGTPHHAIREIPADAGSDGRAELAHLIASGRVVDHGEPPRAKR